MTETRVERIWWCASCGCEFDPEDPNVKLVQKLGPTHCLITEGGRAHSLSRRTWNQIRRQRELENRALSVSRNTIRTKEENAVAEVEQ